VSRLIESEHAGGELAGSDLIGKDLPGKGLTGYWERSYWERFHWERVRPARATLRLMDDKEDDSTYFTGSVFTESACVPLAQCSLECFA